MNITINLTELLAILGCGVLGCLILLLIHVIGILSEIKKTLVNNRDNITNTLTSVSEISTSTKDAYGAVAGKITNFVNKKGKVNNLSIDDELVDK